MNRVLSRLGDRIAKYLSDPAPGYEPFTPSDPDALLAVLEPGDVLLVEGNSRISGAIKYLTNSTWSHAALYVGPIPGRFDSNGDPCVLVEAELGLGVIASPLSRHMPYHTRVCRPVGLTDTDRAAVCRYAIDRIGLDYDLKNVIDLARFLIPMPVPARFRRRMLELGSGDPTKLICSVLIAQAFQTVRYPILPKVTRIESRQARREILHIRHSSLFMPRDFDISPYFEVVKPTIERGFDYRRLHWADLPLPPDEEDMPVPAAPAARRRRRRPARLAKQTPPEAAVDAAGAMG